jgi:hypothetical protein
VTDAEWVEHGVEGISILWMSGCFRFCFSRQPALRIELERFNDVVRVVVDGINWNADIYTGWELQSE